MSAAGDGSTEQNLYFCPVGRNANESCHPDHKIKGGHSPPFILCPRRDSNNPIAICRWHIAATSSKTGGYLNFCPWGRNANESLSSTIHEKSELLHDRKCVRIFCLYQRHYILMLLPRGFHSPLGIFCFIHTLEAMALSS